MYFAQNLNTWMKYVMILGYFSYKPFWLDTGKINAYDVPIIKSSFIDKVISFVIYSTHTKNRIHFYNFRLLYHITIHVDTCIPYTAQRVSLLVTRTKEFFLN